jgi:zinc protease
VAPSPAALAKLLVVERRPPETFTLANGLQAIVLPSRRAPIVTQLMVYKVGSADETFGKTGIAHFLEHMMFKGTPSVGPTEFSRIVSRNGGRDNAFTDFDQTGYYQTIAADRLELVMRMEADRMANLRIVEQELTPERQVVLEERRMRIDNVPSALLDEKARAELFGERRPYGMPTAGFVEDVEKLSVDDLMGFYRRFYTPNNAVLIVAGDTTTEAVAKLAEQYYGPIPGRAIEARTRPAEGGPSLPQRATRADARVAEPAWGRDYLAPSYRVGETRHAYALQVLSRLFGGSETSRLWRELVTDSHLALSAGAGYSASSLGLSSFGIDVNPARGASFAEIEQAIAYEMKKVLDGTISAEEVERAQNQLLAAAIYAQDSMGSGPRRYGVALCTGNSVADVDAWPQRIAAVGLEDVVAAARHVWRDTSAVTSTLTPPALTPSEGKSP